MAKPSGSPKTTCLLRLRLWLNGHADAGAGLLKKVLCARVRLAKFERSAGSGKRWTEELLVEKIDPFTPHLTQLWCAAMNRRTVLQALVY